jgi:hypothetical protein
MVEPALKAVSLRARAKDDSGIVSITLWVLLLPDGSVKVMFAACCPGAIVSGKIKDL